MGLFLLKTYDYKNHMGKGSDEMILKKILNNNVLICVDENENEYLAIGRGISFNQKRGEIFDDSKVERLISLSEAKENRLLEIVKEIPEQCLELSEEIIEYAQSVLQSELSDSIYVTLTDHIHFTKQRYEDGFLPKNSLKWDIQRYYPKEFEIGKKAVSLLEEEMSIKLNEDEAASIALHIVNAELDSNMHQSMEMVELMDNIMQIIKYHTKITLDDNDLDYQRLITHVKFFVQRIMANKQHDVTNPLYMMVKLKYEDAFAISEKIQEFIKSSTSFDVAEDEITYLTIHIKRLLDRKQ